MSGSNLPLSKRIANKTQKDITGCLLFKGVLDAFGYGRIWANGKWNRVHRIVWTLVNGPIPPGKHVLHTCDVRNCINPKHLFLGTHKDNMQDAAIKGRLSNRPTKCGENHGCHKLTDKEVRAIRKDKRLQTIIAKEYGVTFQCISKIKNRRTWKHLD